MKRKFFSPKPLTSGRLFSTLILFAGTTWIGYKIFQEGSSFWVELDSFDVKWLLFSTLLGFFAVLLNGFVFAYLLKIHCKENSPSLFESLSLHFTGQIARHLPGRFWGVVYQINEIKHRIDPIKIIKVNVDHILIFLYFNTAVSIAILLFFQVNYGLGLFFFAASALAFFVILKIDLFNFLIKKTAQLLPEKLYKKVEKYTKISPYTYSGKQSSILFFFLLLSWGIYLFSWQNIALAYPFLSSVNIFLLCALYTISWLVGFISMVTPSGWGVRESVFIILTSKISVVPHLGIFTVFVRLWLLVIDLILFFTFMTMQMLTKNTSTGNRETPPLYTRDGLNILDHNDTLGKKSEYITLLQEMAIKRYFPKGSPDKVCVDVGCGFGRLADALTRCGWQVVGIDPDSSALQYAKEHYHTAHFCCASLPELPFMDESVHCFVFHNILRSFLLLGILDVVDHIEKYIVPGGWLVVVDNIRDNDNRYVKEDELVQKFRRQKFELIDTVPIRQGRWWLLYCIRYGLVPRSLFPHIAKYELKKRKNQKNPKYTYVNKIFLFQKNQAQNASY